MELNFLEEAMSSSLSLCARICVCTHRARGGKSQALRFLSLPNLVTSLTSSFTFLEQSVSALSLCIVLCKLMTNAICRSVGGRQSGHQVGFIPALSYGKELQKGASIKLISKL